ncbi:hypothetical protein CC79DRAFT_133026 [Sarocladium strictum]
MKCESSKPSKGCNCECECELQDDESVRVGPRYRIWTEKLDPVLRVGRDVQGSDRRGSTKVTEVLMPQEDVRTTFAEEPCQIESVSGHRPERSEGSWRLRRMKQHDSGHFQGCSPQPPPKFWRGLGENARSGPDVFGACLPREQIRPPQLKVCCLSQARTTNVRRCVSEGVSVRRSCACHVSTCE